MALPYPGWNVVYGEIPAASKWSQIGANMDAIAAGTGLNDDILDSQHYKDASIDSEHLAPNTILLGVASTTTTQTGMTNSLVNLNGMTLTVTVPPGGRRLRLSFTFPNFNSTGGAADQCRVFFKEGATTMSSATDNPSSAFGHLFFGSYLFTPTAGVHTYYLAYQRTNGTGTGATNADVDAICQFEATLV